MCPPFGLCTFQVRLACLSLAFWTHEDDTLEIVSVIH